MPNATHGLDDYLSSWSNLPKLAEAIIENIFMFLVYIAVFIGSIMIVWGAIEWATGYNENGGRKNIIRGVVLVIISMAPVLVSSM